MAKGQTSQWKSLQQCNNTTIKQIITNSIGIIKEHNYKNEVMSPKQNSYFYDTTAA